MREQAFAQAISITEALRADAPALAAGLQGEIEQWLPSYQYAVDRTLREQPGECGGSSAAGRPGQGACPAGHAGSGRPGLDALADPQEIAAEQSVRAEVARARQAEIAKPGVASKAALEAALRKEEDFNLSLYSSASGTGVAARARPGHPARRPCHARARRQNRGAQLLHRAEQCVPVRGEGRDKPEPREGVYAEECGNGLDGLIRSFRAQIAARDLDYRGLGEALCTTL